VPDQGPRRAATAALVLGALAVAVLAINLPAFFGPLGGLALIVVGVPYGLLAASAIGVGLALRSGLRNSDRLAIGWAAAVAVLTALWLLSIWVPLIAQLGRSDMSINVLLPDFWLPIPFFLGAVYVLLELTRPGRAVVGLVAAALVVAALAIGLTAAGWVTRSDQIGPAPTPPAGVPVESAETEAPP
jgi:hypothetical protein